MTAHVVMPAIDPGVPATMSHKVLTGLLRDELGFEGLIVTDALDMAGAAATYPADVAPVQALLRRRRPAARPAADGHGLRRGAQRRQQRRAQQAAHRRVRLPDPAAQVPARASSRTRWSTWPQRRRSWAPRSTWPTRRRSPTARRRSSRTTPTCCRWLPVPARCSSPAGEWAPPRRMANALTARGATTQVRESGTTPSQTAINNAVAAAQTSDLVVVSTNNAYAVNAATGQPTAAAAAQTKLVQALLATGKPVVVAAMRNPYDVASFPEAPTVVDTFGYTAHQIESLVRVHPRRGEPGRQAARLDPQGGRLRRDVPVRPRPGLLTPDPDRHTEPGMPGAHVPGIPGSLSVVGSLPVSLPRGAGGRVGPSLLAEQVGDVDRGGPEDDDEDHREDAQQHGEDHLDGDLLSLLLGQLPTHDPHLPRLLAQHPRDGHAQPVGLTSADTIDDRG